MKTLNEKQIMNVLLENHKLTASSFSNLILESSCQNIRNDATNILSGTFQHQKQIFDLMAQKGWYQVQNVTQQELGKAQQELSGTVSNYSM